MAMATTPGLGTGRGPGPGPGLGPSRESGAETVKRPSAEQDVNFAAKRDAQGCEAVRGNSV